jgi:hypothetical protein
MRAALLLVVLCVAGCARPQECSTSQDCAAGLVCVLSERAGSCTAPRSGTGAGVVLRRLSVAHALPPVSGRSLDVSLSLDAAAPAGGRFSLTSVQRRRSP